MNLQLSSTNGFRQKEAIVLLICVLLGFGLRFYALDQKSLWIDEIYTLNDSKDGIKGQIEFYGKNPTYLQAPLFFILTHLFYPFSNPERDLRIIPLIAGTLSIPMIYFLCRLFSPQIALPCMISLTFMAYHIHLSQDGRSYSLLLLSGMLGLYFLFNYLKTSKNKELFLAAFFYATLFYLSYSSVLFIILSQVIWFYWVKSDKSPSKISSFLIFNGLIFLFCLPWILFLFSHYSDHPFLAVMDTQSLGSFGSILYGILSDWCIQGLLKATALLALILFPFFAPSRKNAFVLLGVLVLPPTLLYLFCDLFKIYHFISSRYFINILPLFFIALFLSLDRIEGKLKKISRYFHLKLFFTLFFVVFNLFFLPQYYPAEKQDFRKLVRYLENHLKDRDRIFIESIGNLPGMLHYFGVIPESRHYTIPISDTVSQEIDFKITLTSRNKIFSIVYSKSCCNQYTTDENRIWVVVGAPTYHEIKKNSPLKLKGIFDGSVSYFRRFPSDASMYLLLWDPLSE
jgi:hypothetical protein